MTERTTWRRGRHSIPALIAIAALIAGMIVSVAGVQPRLTTAQTTQATTPASAKLTPSTVPVYLSVSLDPASPQLVQGDELLGRLRLGQLIDQAVASANEEITGSAGFSLASGIPGGEIALLVTDPGVAFGDDDADDSDRSESSGLVALIVAPDQAATIAADEEAMLRQEAEDDDDQPRRTTYNGVSIVSVEDNEAFAQVGDAVVFGDTPQDLYGVIDVFSGDVPSLAENESFAAMRADLPADAVAFSYIDGPSLRAPLQQSILDNVSRAAVIYSVLPYLNNRFGMAIAATESDFRFELRVTPGPGEPEPTASTVPDLQLDQQVSGDTALFFNGTDFGTSTGVTMASLLLAQGVASIISDQTGIILGEPAQYFEAAQRVLTFNIADVFAQMTGEYALAASATSLDVGGVDAVLISGVDDADLVRDAVAKTAVLLNAATFDNGNGLTPAPSVRTVDGGTVQVLDLPVDDAGTVLHVEMGVVSDRFLIGYRSGLSEFLAGPASTLADNPRYQAAMASLPAERDWQLYVDLGTLIPLAQQASPEIGSETAAFTLDNAESLSAAGFSRNGMLGMTLILAIPGADSDAVASPVAGR